MIARPAPRHRLLSRRLHHHPPRTAPVRPGPEPPALRCRRSSRTTRRGQRPPAAPPEPPRPCGAAAPARGAFSTTERGQRPPRGPRSRPGRMCSPRYSPRSSSGPPGKSPAPPRPPTAVPAGLTEHLDVALGDGVEGAAGQQDNVGLGGLRHGPGPAQPQPLFVSRCGCGGGREGGREGGKERGRGGRGGGAVAAGAGTEPRPPPAPARGWRGQPGIHRACRGHGDTRGSKLACTRTHKIGIQVDMRCISCPGNRGSGQAPPACTHTHSVFGCSYAVCASTALIKGPGDPSCAVIPAHPSLGLQRENTLAGTKDLLFTI